jgi:hypothetical protein
MNNILKFLALILFFSLIPSIIIWKSTNFYLDSIEENKINEKSIYISNSIKKFKRDINLEKDKERIFSEIMEKLGKFTKLETKEIQVIENYSKKKFPNLIDLVIFKTENNETGETKLIKLIFPKKLKYKFLFKKTGKHLIKKLCESKKYQKIITPTKKMLKKINSKSIKMINAKIFGKSNNIENIFKKRTFNNEITFNNKKANFFWDALFIRKNKSDKSKIFAGLVCLIIYDDIYKEKYSIKGLLNQKKESLKKEKIDLKLIELSTKSINLLSNREKNLLNSISGNIKYKKINGNIIFDKINVNIKFLKTLSDDENFYYLLPLRETDKYTLLATLKKKDCYPEKSKYKLISSVLTIIYILLFIIISALIYSGSLNIFISVRTQLIALFLLALFLPLSAVFYLGFKYLDLSHDMFINQKYENIKEHISSLEEKQLDIFENIRTYLVKAKYNEATICLNKFKKKLKEDYNLTFNAKEFEDINYLREYKDKIFEPLHENLQTLKNERLIDNYYIDPYNHILLLSRNRK